MAGYRLEELSVGQTAETRHVVNAATIDAFAAVSGDSNPVHLDEVFAATTTFKAASPMACCPAPIYRRL